MQLLQIIDARNYDPSMPKLIRTAARAIIFHGEKAAMIQSKSGDIKFPGGGMEMGESPIDTLVREVWQETGLHVISRSCFPFGEMLERRKDRCTQQIFEHHSYYYFCDIASTNMERRAICSEAALSYRLVWVTLQEACSTNMNIPESQRAPWTIRDTLVMKRMMDLFPLALSPGGPDLMPSGAQPAAWLIQGGL